MDFRIIRITEVVRLTGLSRSTIRRLETAQRFPARVPISTRNVGWLESDIHAWMKRLKQSAQQKESIPSRAFEKESEGGDS